MLNASNRSGNGKGICTVYRILQMMLNKKLTIELTVPLNILISLIHAKILQIIFRIGFAL